LKEYTVYYAGKPFASVSLKKEGLYTCIRCRCSQTDGIVKIAMRTFGKEFLLGTCVPLGHAYGFDTKIPAKYINEEKITFYIPGEETKRFIPVDENEPFDMIKHLRKSRFAIEGGKAGVRFQD